MAISRNSKYIIVSLLVLILLLMSIPSNYDLDTKADVNLIKKSNDGFSQPTGSINVTSILGDKQSWEDDFRFTTSDMLEINISISSSSVNIEISFSGKRIKIWEDETIRFYKKIATNKNGTYHLKIENPGISSGGDNLKVEGYYIIIPNAANEALITLNANKIPWNISIIEITGLMIMVIISMKHKKY